MRALLGLVPLLPFAFAVACGDADERPAASGGGGTTNPGGPSSPGTGSSGSTDGGAATDSGDDPDACGVVEQASPDEVQELAISSDPPPPLGGTIAPGKYILSEMNAYVGEETVPGGPGPGLTGVVGRGTIVINGTTMRVLRSRSGGDAGAVSEEGSYAFEVKGTSVDRKKSCPSSGAEGEIPFTATTGSFALFVDPGHRELYVRAE